MEPLVFDFVLEDAAGGGIKIPFDVRGVFGKARVPVVVTVRGGREHSYRSTVAVYGGEYYVPLNKVNAAAAEIAAGEAFAVSLVRDDAPRTVELPDDLAGAIDEVGLRGAWDRLSFSHQRENVESVESAKKVETRQRRIQGVIARLS